MHMHNHLVSKNQGIGSSWGFDIECFFFYAGKLNSRRIEPANFTYICFMPKQQIFVKSLMSRNQVDKRKLCEPASHVDIKK